MGKPIKGAILEKGEAYYTVLPPIFAAIRQAQNRYNWLITDFEGFPDIPEGSGILPTSRYCWLTGEELAALAASNESYQWVWAVMSGFDKNISLEEVLEYSLPGADGYSGFWKNPVSIQHPLAEVEIVAFDSSLTLVISRDGRLVDSFRKAFPLSEDLGEYNARYAGA